jgi:prevent-host-death family protein
MSCTMIARAVPARAGRGRARLDSYDELAIIAMMKTASISTIKNNLSAYLDLVRGGETVLITDRGRPVARLAPLEAGDDADDAAHRVDLERRGIIRRAIVDGRALRLDELAPLPSTTGDIVEALLAEREEGR